MTSLGGNLGSLTLAPNGSDSYTVDTSVVQYLGSADIQQLTVLVKASSNGEIVSDFFGNGPLVANALRFEGFGSGATFTNNAGTEFWTITHSNGTEISKLVGVTTLDLMVRMRYQPSTATGYTSPDLLPLRRLASTTLIDRPQTALSDWPS